MVLGYMIPRAMTGVVRVYEPRESDALKHTRDGKEGQTGERLGVLRINVREMVTRESEKHKERE